MVHNFVLFYDFLKYSRIKEGQHFVTFFTRALHIFFSCLPQASWFSLSSPFGPLRVRLFCLPFLDAGVSLSSVLGSLYFSVYMVSPGSSHAFSFHYHQGIHLWYRPFWLAEPWSHFFFRDSSAWMTHRKWHLNMPQMEFIAYTLLCTSHCFYILSCRWYPGIILSPFLPSSHPSVHPIPPFYLLYISQSSLPLQPFITALSQSNLH